MSQWHDPWMGSQKFSHATSQDNIPVRTSTPHPSHSHGYAAPSSVLWSTTNFELEEWLSDDMFSMEPEGGNTGLSLTDELEQSPEYPSQLVLDEESQGQNFSNFSQWIDGMHRPKAPCVLCRDLKLQCIILRTGEANPNPSASCASCVALFRECSFAPGVKRQPAEFEIPSITSGHLHGVTEEDSNRSFTGPFISDGQILENSTGIAEKTSPSRYNISNQKSRSEMSSGRRGYRFQRTSRNILRAWYSAHREDPYPSEEEKAQLAADTGLSKTQINDWFSNTRRHHQKKDIIDTRNFKAPDLSGMSPMQRWRNSPPENDSLPVGIVNDTLYLKGPIAKDATSTENFLYQGYQTQRHALSISSIESGESSHSNSSASSAWSNASHISKQRRRRHKTRIKTQSQNWSSSNNGPYMCLFCGKPFKKKYDWQRHERSIHLPLETWVCAPDKSGTVFDNGLSQIKCAFCRQLNPDNEHMKSHDLEACISRSLVERTFLRKDHFRQHIRKFHGVIDPDKSIWDSWRLGTHNVTSRCGFCGAVLESWNVRIDHIATHFDAGMLLKDWKGDWGFGNMIEQSIRDFVPLHVLRGESTPVAPNLIPEGQSLMLI